MTNEEAIKYIDWALMNGRWVNGQIPRNFIRDEKWQAGELAIKALENERPHGEWIKVNPESRGYAEFFRCSNCLSNIQMSYWGKECEYDYCPNCGADMRGGAGNDSI